MKLQDVARFAVPGALIVFLLPGCGRGSGRPRAAVQGNVTFQGASLPHGSIEFTPLAPDGTSSGTNIVEGHYRIPASAGLPPGEYLVRIYAATSDTAPLTPEQAAMPQVHRPGVETIPPRYNSQTELRVEVPDTRAKRFNFELGKRSRRTYWERGAAATGTNKTERVPSGV